MSQLCYVKEADILPGSTAVLVLNSRRMVTNHSEGSGFVWGFRCTTVSWVLRTLLVNNLLFVFSVCLLFVYALVCQSLLRQVLFFLIY